MIFAHLLRISCFGFVAMTLCLTGITHASNVTQTNNNGIIALQNASGDPMRAGKVKLEYYGHMAFRIITPNGLSMLIDPWKNDPSGTWGIWFPKEFPLTKADIAASTHGHYDHNALNRVVSHMVIDRMAGQWTLSDLRVTGIADKHQYEAPGLVRWTELFAERGITHVPPNNPPILDNTIFIIETGGLRIVHWGDNRPDAPEAVYKAIGRPDILILPIDDSVHVLNGQQIRTILDKLQPHVVIPTHYLIKNVSSVASTLHTADKWVATQPSVKNVASSIVVTPEQIKKFNGHVLYFGQNVMGYPQQ